MKHLSPDQLDGHADILLSRAGEVITVRHAGVADAESLQTYFRGLSVRSRYNRLMGAASELPAGVLDRFIHSGEDNGFSLVATTRRDGAEAIVGEARYAIDDETDSVEIGLSIDDTMQRQGLGAALMANLECRAAAIDARTLLGDTLRSNDAMLGLARAAGFRLMPTPGDWRQMRFEKQIARAAEMTCARWRLAAGVITSSLRGA